MSPQRVFIPKRGGVVLDLSGCHHKLGIIELREVGTTLAKVFLTARYDSIMGGGTKPFQKLVKLRHN